MGKDKHKVLFEQYLRLEELLIDDSDAKHHEASSMKFKKAVDAYFSKFEGIRRRRAKEESDDAQEENKDSQRRTDDNQENNAAEIAAIKKAAEDYEA